MKIDLFLIFAQLTGVAMCAAMFAFFFGWPVGLLAVFLGMFAIGAGMAAHNQDAQDEADDRRADDDGMPPWHAQEPLGRWPFSGTGKDTNP